MKYQLVQQYSEEDCGAACLASIAKHYDRIFTLNRFKISHKTQLFNINYPLN